MSIGFGAPCDRKSIESVDDRYGQFLHAARYVHLPERERLNVFLLNVLLLNVCLQCSIIMVVMIKKYGRSSDGEGSTQKVNCPAFLTERKVIYFLKMFLRQPLR